MAYDLNAVMAAQPKPKAKKKFTFDFDGETYTLPNDVDQIALHSAASGFVMEALERLLGSEQYDTLKKSPTVLQLTAVAELLRAYYAHVGGGATVGESAASSRSLKSTAGPSKRTSRASTPASRRSRS